METFKKKWPYMYDQTFQLKWNLISGCIDSFSTIKPHSILDLGCGPVNLACVDFLKSNDSYVGVDRDSESIERLNDLGKLFIGNTKFIHADYHKMDVHKISGKFNVLLWAGIPDSFGQYNGILKKYLPLIEKGGVIILDYQATSPVGVSKRVSRKLPMRHITGCQLILPYLPKSKYPNHKAINHRIIEVFKKT